MTIDLNAVRALVDAAMPGPWNWPDLVDDPEAYQAGLFSGDDPDPWGKYDRWVLAARWDAGADEGGVVVRHPDAVFIAASRSLVPALCDEIERLWTLCATHGIDPEGCDECFVASAEGRAAHG